MVPQGMNIINIITCPAYNGRYGKNKKHAL